MDGFLKMEIFFAVATASVVVLTVLLSVLLYYAIRLVRRAERIGETVEREALRIAGDIDDARAAARREAGRVLAFISSARRLAARLVASRSSRGS